MVRYVFEFDFFLHFKLFSFLGWTCKDCNIAEEQQVGVLSFVEACYSHSSVLDQLSIIVNHFLII